MRQRTQLVGRLAHPALPACADHCNRRCSYREPGIASPAPSGPRPSLPLPALSARLEILRLLTLLISLPSLLTSPSHFPSLPNNWRESLVSGRAAGRGDKNVVLCLLCSVLNTALNAGAAGAAGTSAGAGVEGLRERAARLAAETAKRTTAPVADGSDEASVKNALVGACLQFLDAVLIDHAPVDGAEAAPNQFAFYLSKLHRPSDFSFLHSGLVGLITTSLAAPSTSSLFPLGLPLPVNISSSSSTSPARTKKPAGWTTEALTILWRTLDTNRKFVSWLVKPHSTSEGKSRLLETLVAVEACMLDWHPDETQIGLVRLASFIMQTISAEAASAGLASKEAEEEVKRVLNAPLEPEVVGARLAGVVRRHVASQGIEVGEERQGERNRKRETKSVSFVEYLLVRHAFPSHSSLDLTRRRAQIVLHALLIPSPTTAAAPQSTRSSLSTLYPSLLLTVSNLSPLFRDVGADAATRLVRVWLAFSAPSWVLMEEGNPRLIFCEFACRLPARIPAGRTGSCELLTLTTLSSQTYSRRSTTSCTSTSTRSAWPLSPVMRTVLTFRSRAEPAHHVRLARHLSALRPPRQLHARTRDRRGPSIACCATRAPATSVIERLYPSSNQRRRRGVCADKRRQSRSFVGKGARQTTRTDALARQSRRLVALVAYKSELVANDVEHKRGAVESDSERGGRDGRRAEAVCRQERFRPDD